MKNLLCFLFLFCFLFCGFAQKNRNNIFFLSFFKELNFSTEPPALTKDNFGIVGNSICDEQGNLVLVDMNNGIYNGNRNLILNRVTTKDSGYIFIPNPIEKNLYYCFSSDEQNNLFYYTFDSSVNNEEGKLSERKILNQKVFTGSEWGVIYHKDIIWLVSITNYQFVCFKIDKNGITETPVISDVLIHKFPYYPLFRPNMSGSKILVDSELGGVLYDFDKTNGTVSNPFELGITNATYYEFSPDGRFLYTTEQNDVDYKLYQYKIDVLSKNEILQSKKEIASNVSGYDWRSIGLAPNGKIYVAQIETIGYLGVINQPNQEGSLCDYQVEGISLAGLHKGVFIPVLFRGSDYEPPQILTQNLCSTILFSISNSPQSALWNFGDGSTSTDINASHTYTNSGTYTVQVTVNYSDGTSQTLTKPITIQAKPSKISIWHD